MAMSFGEDEIGTESLKTLSRKEPYPIIFQHIDIGPSRQKKRLRLAITNNNKRVIKHVQ
jgi:hypothetical protein